jgi:glycine/D-amino acid oxidase-like deaminating enzyme
MAAPHVLVIGGGVIGAASAYYLSEAGVRVTVVERGDVGGGTSSRCDGNVLAIDKDPGYDGQLALKSQELLAELAGRLGPMEYRSPGSYLVCDGDDEVDAAREWVERQRASGLPFRFLDHAAIHRALPDLAPDIPAGLYCRSDATLNPLLYVARLIEAARARGAEVRAHTPVDRIETVGSRVTGVRLVGGERIEADAVVLAAGVWSPELAGPLDLALPIRPRKGHLLVSARGPIFGTVKVMEFGYLMSKFGRDRKAPADALRYGVALVYEPTMSGNFLLGSSREFQGFDITPNPDVVRAIARRAQRFYPAMARATIIRSYAGLRPWTPDHFPIVSGIASHPGLFLAAGHEGDGIGLAAVTGALVRDLVLERAPLVDPAPLSWDRFQPGDSENGAEPKGGPGRDGHG